MIPEAVFAMLASARLAAPHVIVFGGFSAKELGQRIKDTQPKIIVSCSVGLEPNKRIDYKEIVDKAIELSGSNAKCLILQRDIQRTDRWT